MARQGWGVSIATAIGVAAGAGAAQLGFGYGLGVITWTPTDAGATDTAWADGLAWATWLAASSTVLGAVCAQRLHQRTAPATTVVSGQPATVPEHETPSRRTATDRRHRTAAGARRRARHHRWPSRRAHDRGGLLRRVALALAAGLGGLVTVLLVAVPARVATGADTGAPQRTAAVQAALGILIGVLVAIWALRSRAAAVNVTATAAWLWLLAVVSVIDGVRVGRGLTGAQLGTWQFDPDHARYWIGGQLYWPGALLALVPALLIGVLAARRSARSGGHRVGAAASGAAGPMLVALAYLTTLPHWSTLGPAQLSTQLIAPYAVIAGVGGSVLAARLAERAAAEPRGRAQRGLSGHGGRPGPRRRSASPTAGHRRRRVSSSTAGTASRRRRADAPPQMPSTGSLPGEATRRTAGARPAHGPGPHGSDPSHRSNSGGPDPQHPAHPSIPPPHHQLTRPHPGRTTPTPRPTPPTPHPARPHPARVDHEVIAISPGVSWQ